MEFSLIRPSNSGFIPHHLNSRSPEEKWKHKLIRISFHRKPCALAGGTGFTLIEFLIVTSLIIILSVVVLANYEFGGYQLSLRRSAHQLSQNIRRAEAMGMSAREFGGSVPAGGYGIHLNRVLPDNTYYILFADIDGNGLYNTGEEIETIEFEEHIEVTQLCIVSCYCATTLDITFVPPEPIVKFNNNTDSACLFALVDLWSKKTAEILTVYINRVGLIEVK